MFRVALLASLFTFVEGITWTVSGSVTWGQACDWTGGDIGNVASTAENCGGDCSSNSNCDHFTWTNYNGGTCWLKQFGSASVTAINAASSDVCGWVNSRVGGGISWTVSGSVTWASNCDWSGGDIGNVATAGSGCGPACQGNSNCDHFTWTNYNGGTCWLKHFGTINNPSNPAPITGPSGSLCGYLTSQSAPPPSNVVGFYWWSWDTFTPSFPGGTNIGIAFSGYADPSSAISSSAGIKGSLPGNKYIALGGGNSAGDWTSSVLSSVTSSLNNNDFSGYQGIVFDIEQGDSGLSSAFESAFAAAKGRGLKVLVTISHSAPYGFSDASTLMSNFLGSSNIDYISPQLYTTGSESQNDYSTTAGVGWNQYQGSTPQVVPSIVTSGLYSSAQSDFSQQGVTLSGYIQWAN